MSLRKSYRLGKKAGAGNSRAGNKANFKILSKKTKRSTKAAIIGGALVGTATSKSGRKRVGKLLKKGAYKMTAKHKAAISRALKGRKRS